MVGALPRALPAEGQGSSHGGASQIAQSAATLRAKKARLSPAGRVSQEVLVQVLAQEQGRGRGEFQGSRVGENFLSHFSGLLHSQANAAHMAPATPSGASLCPEV